MPAAFITHADCVRHRMGIGHPECPERLEAISDYLLNKGLLGQMTPYDAPLATEAQLARAHSLFYVREILAAAPTEGYRQIDPDTSMNPFSAQAALRAAGAAVLATDLVLSGKMQTAFCCVRPPGHHAERAAAMGFCFFNNVVVGIRHALDVHGLERVALVDFDVHHGNGSEDMLSGDGRVIMCSIFGQGIFPCSGENPVSANMINVPMPPWSGSDKFREVVSLRWMSALDAFQPQLIYISAGFDAHRDDDMGNLELVEADYAWVTQQVMGIANRHCQGRVISCLEGGYEFGALARSAAAHVKVLIGVD